MNIMTIYIMIIIVTIIAAYYTLMSYHAGAVGTASEWKVEDRAINEICYQVSKKQHTIKYIITDKDENSTKIKITEMSMSRNAFRLILLKSFVIVFITPAWGFRKIEHDDFYDDDYGEVEMV